MSSPKVDGGDHYLDRVAQETTANELEGKSKHEIYVDHIVQKCMDCKAEVERVISPEARKLGITEDIVAQAIERTRKYADKYGVEKQIESVQAFLITTSRRLLYREWRRTQRIPTESLDDKRYGGLGHQVVDSSAKGILERLEVDDMIKIALKDATEDQIRLFKLWHVFGMTAEEIAVRLDVTSTTVRTRIHKLNAMMRSAVSGQM